MFSIRDAVASSKSTISSSTGTNSSLVDWVCAQAEANESLSRCGPCEWFRLRPMQVLNLGDKSCQVQAPKLAWFICLTPGIDGLAVNHLQYAKAAIVSAKLNAPTLSPHVILVRHLISEAKHPVLVTPNDAQTQLIHSVSSPC